MSTTFWSLIVYRVCGGLLRMIMCRASNSAKPTSNKPPADNATMRMIPATANWNPIQLHEGRVSRSEAWLTCGPAFKNPRLSISVLLLAESWLLTHVQKHVWLPFLLRVTSLCVNSFPEVIHILFCMCQCLTPWYLPIYPRHQNTEWSWPSQTSHCCYLDWKYSRPFLCMWQSDAHHS